MWQLRPVGALQTRQRLAHVAWNRCLPSLAAYTLEDGSLHTVQAVPEVSSFVLLALAIGQSRCRTVGTHLPYCLHVRRTAAIAYAAILSSHMMF